MIRGSLCAYVEKQQLQNGKRAMATTAFRKQEAELLLFRTRAKIWPAQKIVEHRGRIYKRQSTLMEERCHTAHYNYIIYGMHIVHQLPERPGSS